jgi:hypothetical protein
MITHLLADFNAFEERCNVAFGLDIDYQPLIAKGEELEI